MTPTELGIFIDVQKIRLTDLATTLGCTPSDLSHCINGTRRMEKVRHQLARYFRKPVDALFGPDHDAAVRLARGERVA